MPLLNTVAGAEQQLQSVQQHCSAVEAHARGCLQGGRARHPLQNVRNQFLPSAEQGGRVEQLGEGGDCLVCLLLLAKEGGPLGWNV
eukprot:6441499-Alexandrium_andersonii.AAC.1